MGKRLYQCTVTVHGKDGLETILNLKENWILLYPSKKLHSLPCETSGKCVYFHKKLHTCNNYNNDQAEY